MFWLPENYNGESVDYIYDTCYFGWFGPMVWGGDMKYQQYTKTFFDKLYAGWTAEEANNAAYSATGLTNGYVFRDYENFRLHWPHGYPGPGE
jgi:hypothetical protein